jgi:hypothetical protein
VPAVALTEPEQLSDIFTGDASVTFAGNVLVKATLLTGVSLTVLLIIYVRVEVLFGAIVDGENELENVGVPA